MWDTRFPLHASYIHTAYVYPRHSSHAEAGFRMAITHKMQSKIIFLHKILVYFKKLLYLCSGFCVIQGA